MSRKKRGINNILHAWRKTGPEDEPVKRKGICGRTRVRVRDILLRAFPPRAPMALLFPQGRYIFWRAIPSACRGVRSGVYLSQLQCWDERLREGRAVAARAVIAVRAVGGGAGAEHHRLQRCSQRVREGRAVGTGAVAAQRATESEVGTGRHILCNAEGSASQGCRSKLQNAGRGGSVGSFHYWMLGGEATGKSKSTI